MESARSKARTPVRNRQVDLGERAESGSAAAWFKSSTTDTDSSEATSYIACRKTSTSTSESSISRSDRRYRHRTIRQSGQGRFFALYKSTRSAKTPQRKKTSSFKTNPLLPGATYHPGTQNRELSTESSTSSPPSEGQRGPVVAAPYGKNNHPARIANAITANNKDIDLIVLLIDNGEKSRT